MDSEDSIDSICVAELMREARAKSRGIHTFWEWHDKPVKELVIAREAFEAAQIRITSLKTRGSEDPPDCEAVLGVLRVGIEITELVDQQAIERFKRTKRAYDWADWPREKFVAALKDRIDAKDVPTKVNGGPYDRYFLVIHCDEPLLPSQTVGSYLKGFNVATRLIDEILVILSYQPGSETCPTFRLKAGKSE
jgi:hypothetical protein